MSMVRKIQDKSEFKSLNKRSWEENADFVLENGLPHEYIESLLKKEITRLKEENPNFQTVLDAGCGNGWLRSVVPADLKYTGIDNCRLIIERLNRFSPAFFTLDIEDELEQSQIEKFQSDIVVSSMSLIETPFLNAAMNNLYNLTKQGGYLLITTLNPMVEILRISDSIEEYKANLSLHSLSDSGVFISKKIRCNDSVSRSDYHRILYSPVELIQSAKSSGFDLIDFQERNRREMAINQPAYQYILLKKK